MTDRPADALSTAHEVNAALSRLTMDPVQAHADLLQTLLDRHERFCQIAESLGIEDLDQMIVPRSSLVNAARDALTLQMQSGGRGKAQ